MVSYRKISAVLAVAEAASFRVAADRLGLSQPALTRLIQTYESEIGFKIFGRDTRTVWLTAEGEAFIAECRTLAAHIGLHDEATRAIKAGKRGRLNVGHMDAATLSFLPALIRDFHAAYPHVDIKLNLQGSDQQVIALLSGHLDVGFVLSSARVRGLEYRQIAKYPLTVVMSSQDPRAARQGWQLRDFADDLFIFADRSHAGALMRTIDDLMRQAGIQPRTFYTAQDTLSALAQVRSGHGVTLMPDSAQDFLRDGLHYVGLDDEGACIGVELAHNRATASSVTRRFIDHFEQQMATAPYLPKAEKAAAGPS